MIPSFNSNITNTLKQTVENSFPKIETSASTFGNLFKGSQEFNQADHTRIPHSLSGRVTATSLPVTNAGTVIGFGNVANNCWINSLLQLIISVPDYQAAYLAIAEDAINSNERMKLKHGTNMLKALKEHERASTCVDGTISQNVRVALSNLISTEISTSSQEQEDPYEALALLLAKYSDMLLEKGEKLPAGIYSSLSLKRRFEPQQEIHSSNDYTLLSPENTLEENLVESHILLSLQKDRKLSFDELLNNYFTSPTHDCDSAIFRTQKGKIMKCRPVAEERQYTTPPKHLTIILKRFAMDNFGRTAKLNNIIDVPLVFTLPPQAHGQNKEASYQLDCSIFHKGGYGSGHYIAYRNVEGHWFELDDAACTPVSENTIKSIHAGTLNARFKSYVLHYIRLPNRDQEGEDSDDSSATDLYEITEELAAASAEVTHQLPRDPLPSISPRKRLREEPNEACDPEPKRLKLSQ